MKYSNFFLTDAKEQDKVPIGSTPEEHSLGPPGPSLNAEAYFHPWQSWSLAWGVTKVHTSPKIFHTDLRPPALGPIGLLDRLPTGPTPWPSRPGRRLSRGPSTCLILFILFRPFKWSTHLSKLVKLIVSRKRCLGAWWSRSCGILSKLLDKPCTLWHLHGFLFRKLSISPELHVGQVKSAATLTSERFLGKQLKDISIVDVDSLIALSVH